MQLAGYLTGMMGTGEHARQLVSALRTQRIAVTTTALHPAGMLEDNSLAGRSEGEESSDAFADFLLLCVNADSVQGVADELGRGFFARRYAIGFWAWEVSAFPPRFEPAFELLDEVWVGSHHVRDAVGARAPIPVVRIPQPVSLAPDAAAALPPVGLPDGFRFVFAFDYLSVFERKNPLATVEAFGRAFTPGAGPVLILKTLNHGHDPAAHERLRAAVAAHPDIYLLEDRLSRTERDGLMNAADCYVSLHRAEGFGYTLAEAMWLGKPVIATGYSGNLDYMTDENSYLIGHRLVPIGPGREPYPSDGSWAEPDIEHAALLMREVFERPAEARRRGERAAADIRRTNAPEIAGRAMAERMADVGRSPGWRSSLRRARVHAARAAEMVEAGPPTPPRRRFGAASRGARTVALRLVKPLSAHQDAIDGELLGAVEALSAEVELLGSTHARALDQDAAEPGARRAPASETPGSDAGGRSGD